MIGNISKKIVKAIIGIFAVLIITVILFTNSSLAANSPNIVTQLSYPSIFDILSSQVDGDEVYIRHEDLLSIPSLFCSAKGTALPGYASTVVTSGGKSTDVTDQGISTGVLTEANRNNATVFKTGSPWTTDTTNPYTETKSKTYGRFHLVENRIATPAEAWVLSEMDKNDPSVNSLTFELTDREYTGEINDNNKTVTAAGDELWSVAWDSSSLEPTEYVTSKNGKYYYVTMDSYAPYTYVQHAWWKVKTVGTSNKSGVKDTDLGYEAEAFEEYIKRISPTGDNWQYNSDNTLVVDYKKYISEDGTQKEIGYDSDDAEVRFNSETNKYIVGPFSLDYLRAGTKQGTREKVSFAGISNTTLTGLDAEDNPIDLELGTDYRFVFSHNHEDYIPLITDNGEQIPLDTEEDYPYPYDGEEFYLEISYLDDLVAIESLDFDFQYMNAGASYEYLEGTYLIITWSPWYNSRPASSNTPQTTPTTASSKVINNEIKLAMNISSRAYPSDRGSSGGKAVPFEEVITLDSNSFDQNSEDTKGKIACSRSSDKINIEYTIPSKENTTSSDYSMARAGKVSTSTTTYSMPTSVEVYVDGTKINSSISNGKVTASYDRNYSAPIAQSKIEIKYKYSYTTSTTTTTVVNGKSSTSESTTTGTTAEQNISKTYYYENDIVEKIRFTSTDYTYLKGDTIYLRKLGVVNGFNLDVNTKLKESKIENGYIRWSYFNGSDFVYNNGDSTTLTFTKPSRREIIITVEVYSNVGATALDAPVQRFQFKVMYEPMYVSFNDDIKKDGYKTLTINNFSNTATTGTVYFFNGYNYISAGSMSGVPDNQNPIITEGDDSDLDAGKVVYRSAPDNVEYITTSGALWWKKTNKENVADGYLIQNISYEYYDGFVEEVTVNVNGKIYSTEGYKKDLNDRINDYLNKDESLYDLDELNSFIIQAKNYGIPQETINQLERARDHLQAGQGGGSQGGGSQGGGSQGGDSQGGGSQDEGSQGGGSQGGGSQGGGSQGGGSQGGGSQGGGSQGGGSQGGGSQGGGSQGGGSQGGGSQGGGSQGGGSQGGGSQGGDSQEGNEGEPTQGGINSGLQSNGARYYQYYLRYTNQSEHIAQHQINGKDSVKKDIDAQNGGGFPEEETISLQIIPKPIDLRTSLSGMVWIDNDEQKDKSEYGNLGIYDEGTKDKPAEKNSVEIIVWKVKYEVATGKEVEREKALGWDDSEKEIDFDKTRIYVDENGQYKIPKMQVPAEEGLDGTKYVMSYDVEFIYDGQTYEATEYLVPSSGEDKTSVKDKLDAFKKTADETKGPEKDYADYANSSYIVENAEERKKFDSYFTEVYGKDVMDNDGNTEGLATGGINDGKYYHDYDVDPTRGIKETDLEYTSEKVGEGDYEKRKSNLVTNDEEGYVLDQYRFAARTSEAGLLLPYERLYHVEEKFYDNYEFQANQYKPIDEYFHQINLGLLERYHSDLGVKKDLYTANVVVNGNSNLTTYNSLMPLTEEALNLQVKPEYRQHTYKIDLYNSDYMYRSGAYSSIQDEITKTIIEAIKEGTELRLFVTYKLEFINESVFTDVSINEFVDYYDKTFTRVDEDVKAQIEDQTADDDEPSRVEKIVAYAPYYRKLTTVAGASAYNYNKAEDLNESLDESGNVRNTVVNSAGELILDKTGDKFATGSVEFEDIEETNAERKNSNYKRSVSKSLNGLNGSGPNEDLTLEPGEVLEVFVTYEVDEDGYKKVQQETEANADTRKDTLLGKKNNIVEISKYSTFYTEESCQRHKTTSYLPKQVSGRVDQDSAPNNIRMKDRGDSIDTKMLEDDTEFAPCVTVEVREGEPRTLDGVVWEDLRSDNTVGNGKYDEGTESGIKGIDVTMVEKIRVTKEDLDRIRKYAQENNSSVAESLNDLNTLCHEFEYIWKTDDFPGFENEIKSGDDGKYTFKNFVTGTYVVRFEYGNDADENVDMKYNGQDYKNTAYQVAKDGSIRLNPTKVAMAGENQDVPIDTTDILHLPGKATLNNEWHDLSANENAKALEEDRVSDARDYEPQRLRTIAYSRTIANENAEVLAAAFNETKDVTGEDTKDHISEDYKKILENNKQKLVENTRMVANTAKLFVDIEKQDTIAYKKVVTPDGEDIIKTTEAKDGKHEYYIKNIDFGLVERPETRMNIRKEISKIELYKEDGGEVILSVRCDENGNIIKEGADNIRVDKISEIHKESLGDGQGFKYIAMESSLLNGLQVRLTYTIDIINNSEEDYVSATLANYKGMNEIYKLANHFENVSEERLYSEENLQGTVPFNAGKAIIYGRFLGTYYYTNKDIADSEDINKTYAAIDEDGKTINKYDDEVIVKTTIDQVVDYIDNDLSISLDDINYENMSWVASSDADIQHKLSEIAFRKGEDGKYVKDITKLQDDKERAYISKSNDKTTKNNIYLSTNNTMVEKPTKIEYKVAEIDDKKQPVMEIDNNKLQPSIITEEFDAYTSKENVNSIDNSNTSITTQLVPDSYKAKTNAGNVTSTATISIVTTAQANEESVNNMNYDNLIEVAMYSNSVGRRDMQTIPGNANMIAKDNKAYLAGYIKAYDSNSQSYVFKTQTVNGVNTERDAYAARDTVTFSEPTGLSLARQQANKTIRILLASLIISAIAVVAAIIVTAIRRNKYDDGDILKNKS